MDCFACRRRFLTVLSQAPSTKHIPSSLSRLPASTRLLTTKRNLYAGPVSSKPRRPFANNDSRDDRPPGRRLAGRETPRHESFRDSHASGGPTRSRLATRSAVPRSPMRSQISRPDENPILGVLPRQHKMERARQETRPVQEQGLDSRGKKHRHGTKRSARQQRRSVVFGAPTTPAPSKPLPVQLQPPPRAVQPSTPTYTAQRQTPREPWAIQKAAIQAKLKGATWNPHRRLSPTTIEGIRAMNANDPTKFTTSVLAKEFDVNPEEIRRILKSKWKPSADEAEERNARWERRGEKIWEALSEERGYKPPAEWRRRGVGSVEGGQKDVKPRWKEKRGDSAGVQRRDRDRSVPFEGIEGTFPMRSGPVRPRRAAPSEGRPAGRQAESKISISETIASALAMSKNPSGKGLAGKIL